MASPGTWQRWVLLLALVLAPAALPTFRAAGAPGRDRLNEKVEPFTLHDAAGRPWTLDRDRGKQATVVVFLSFDCPVCTSYLAPLAELHRAYAGRDVSFVGVNVGDESPPQLEKLVRDFQVPFPVLRDPRPAADALRARVTPEVFVLDAKLVLRYRGRIDDRYAARLRPNARVTSHDLRRALDEVLSGQAVAQPATEAVGCPLPGSGPNRPATGKVTYYRDVLPILQRHCQECHRPGEVGPFALMTYRQAVNWAADIKDFTGDRRMPPWKPTESLPMHGERRLAEAEIATLAAWVDGGTPEGDPATAPSPRQFAEGWQLGPPDLVLTPEEAFVLGAGGTDLYRCFLLPTALDEDRYVAAVEIRPGNRKVVHHAILFTDTTGRARQMAAQARGKNQGRDDRGPGYSLPLSMSFLPGFLPRSGLGGWAPGTVIRRLPDGAGFHLPPRADIVMQLHYHRTGRTEKDRTSVGLYFARKGTNRHVHGVAVPGHFLFIPAGAARYRVSGSAWIRQDCRLHMVTPHMHLLGREIRLTLVPPGGRPQTLVAIRDWDFNWQETYFLKEPVAIKAGTRIDVEGVYDNSERNINNPHHPPRAVFFGLETRNEMCVGFLGMTSDRPGAIRYDVQPRIQGLDWTPSWGIPLPGI
jgi:peroxiredoxin